MRGSAVVIGAGIAGLATARGLLGAGWSVRVLERSSGLPGAGTALGMWPEAMRALDRLGVGEQVRAASVEQRGARLLRPDGTEIAHLGPGARPGWSPGRRSWRRWPRACPRTSSRGTPR